MIALLLFLGLSAHLINANNDEKVEVIVPELSLDELERLVFNDNQYTLDAASMRMIAQDLIRRIKEMKEEQENPPEPPDDPQPVVEQVEMTEPALKDFNCDANGKCTFTIEEHVGQHDTLHASGTRPQTMELEVEVDASTQDSPSVEFTSQGKEVPSLPHVETDPMKLAARILQTAKEQEQLAEAAKPQPDYAFQREIKDHLKKIVQNSINALLAKWADGECHDSTENGECNDEPHSTPHFACFSTHRRVLGMFDIATNEWLRDAELDSVSHIRKNAAAVGLPFERQPHLMFLGGLSVKKENTYSAEVVLLNLASLKAFVQPPLPVALSGHRAIMFAAGTVLVCGGRNAPNAVPSTDCYVLLIHMGRSEQGPPLTVGRADFSMVTSPDRKHVFALGGIGKNGEYLSSTEYMEISTVPNMFEAKWKTDFEWKPLIADNLATGGVELPVPTSQLGCVVLNVNSIICAGGQTTDSDRVKSVYTLSLQSPPPKWTSLPDLHYEDAFGVNGQLTVVGGWLYAVGDMSIQRISIKEQSSWEYVSWRGCKQPAVGSIL